MTSAIACITYRRSNILKQFVASIKTHAPGYPLAIFEDCATHDDAAAFLLKDATPAGYDKEFDSDKYVWKNGTEIYLARRNEGVAGGSNKAMRWFERGGWDHLCLCNDDVIAKGDFPAVYGAAHQKLGVGLWCFCDFKHEAYVGPVVPVKGFRVKIHPRMVGIMMSMTAKLVKDVGYFTADWCRWGNEHCDLNNRARLMGFCNLNGQAHGCLDIETPTIASHGLEAPSSVFDYEKPQLDNQAANDINRAQRAYAWEDLYRPFRLPHGRQASAFGGFGMSVHDLEGMGYQLIIDRSE